MTIRRLSVTSRHWIEPWHIRRSCCRQAPSRRLILDGRLVVADQKWRLLYGDYPSWRLQLPTLVTLMRPESHLCGWSRILVMSFVTEVTNTRLETHYASGDAIV
jgi:hypothetical protein